MAQAKIIIGDQRGLRTVMERVQTVASRDVPVLLYGETGTGKEVIALAIHERSARVGKPFKRVNCGAISPELVDSELFGHEHGAFTGTTALHRGWFEQADGGTLFLDEVAELSLSAQVRLLRVLQEGEFCRVGGEKTLRVDVRIIAATHSELPLLISSGQFREDLYYRLAVFPIVIPPLRDRQEDIYDLAVYFANRASRRFGLRPVTVSESDVQLLQEYRWPGNIREFAAVVNRAILLGNGRSFCVKAALGIEYIPVMREVSSVEPSESGAGEIASLEAVIREHIERVLRVCHGRIDGMYGAARILDINPSTLRSKIRKMGIDISSFR